MSTNYRPILQNDTAKPDVFHKLSNQKQWVDRVERMVRGKTSEIVSVEKMPKEALKKLKDVRFSDQFDCFSKPLIMGILNVTPDSFSDGGQNFKLADAMRAVEKMIAEGADIIDIGGESTRPGAKEISDKVELLRIEPVISEIKNKFPNCQISVDTRKASVMARALELGVTFINDVSALTFDRKSKGILTKKNAQVCLMHGGLNPKKMQKNIFYDNVILDVYDYLKGCIDSAVLAGIKKENIIIDPGIGFGKTYRQNIQLIQNASLFHSLGCPVLFGVSRKSFIGHIGQAVETKDRFPGSISVAIELIRQGVQIIRVHDCKETRQAFALYEAIQDGFD